MSKEQLLADLRALLAKHETVEPPPPLPVAYEDWTIAAPIPPVYQINYGKMRIVLTPVEHSMRDPIKPEGGIHQHTFYTSPGGPLNASDYYHPTLWDGEGNAVAPESALVYYERRRDVAPMPNGLRYVGGKFTWQVNRGRVKVVGKNDSITANSLRNWDLQEGDLLTLSFAPYRWWNGVDLDSHDHQAHVSYIQRPGFVEITGVAPKFQFRLDWGGDYTKLQLSSDHDKVDHPLDGSSAHWEYIANQHPRFHDEMEAALSAGMNDSASQANLNNGYRLKPFSGERLPRLSSLTSTGKRPQG